MCWVRAGPSGLGEVEMSVHIQWQQGRITYAIKWWAYVNSESLPHFGFRITEEIISSCL